MCQSLTPKTPTVQRGGKLPPFTCKASGDFQEGGYTYAEFRVLDPDNYVIFPANYPIHEEKVPVNNNQAVWQYGEFIPSDAKAGNYLVQCRMCAGSECTPWETSAQSGTSPYLDPDIELPIDEPVDEPSPTPGPIPSPDPDVEERRDRKK